MKNITIRTPHINLPKFTIPKAWSVFVVCAVIALFVALAHDALVFYQYGAGWQRDLEVTPITTQTFRESELDAVLATIDARVAELERIRREGVQIKNLFGEK